MRANHHNRFTQGMIKGRDENPEYYIPPGVHPPRTQTQTDQVLKRPTVRIRKSKYQKD